MHVVEIGQREEDVAAEELEPAAGVAGVVVEQALSGCRWRRARRQALGGGVLAADALAGDERDALGEAAAVEAGHELGDLGGRVLAVAVEGADGARRAPG